MIGTKESLQTPTNPPQTGWVCFIALSRRDKLSLMNKWLRVIAVIALGFVLWPGVSYAANCGDTDGDGVTDATCACGDTVVGASGYLYELSGDLMCSGNGLLVGASDITIDGNNYSIAGPTPMGSSKGIYNAGGYDNVTIRNFGDIAGFATGIHQAGGVLDAVIADNVISSRVGIDLDTATSVAITGNILRNNYDNGFYGDGIRLVHAASSTIAGNSISVTANGVYVANGVGHVIEDNEIDRSNSAITIQGHSRLNTVTNNAVSKATFGVTFDSSSNTVEDNTFVGGVYGVFINSGSGHLFRRNTIMANALDFYDSTDGSVFQDNLFFHNLSSTAVVLNNDNRLASSTETVEFSLELSDTDDDACSSCTATVTVTPDSALDYEQDGNAVSGSFTPTRRGTYSLSVIVTDPDGNETRKNFLYFIDATGVHTSRYYMRGVDPTNGQPASTDAKSMLLSAPTVNEEWECTYWVQNSPDQLPLFPLSNLKSASLAGQYAMFVEEPFICNELVGDQFTECWVGLQRYGTFGQAIDVSDEVSGPTDFIPINKNFADLNWSMDYPEAWYRVAVKLNGSFPYWRVNQSEATYVDFNQQYTTTPAIKSVSNPEINILAATADLDDDAAAEIVLENRLTIATSTTLTVVDHNRPFIEAPSVVDATGTTTVSALLDSGEQSALTAAFLELAPDAGSVEVSVSDWVGETREWSEAGTGAESAQHVIGDLTPNATYDIKVDGALYGSYTADANGQIAFNYTGGYSTHTFNLLPHEEAAEENEDSGARRRGGGSGRQVTVKTAATGQSDAVAALLAQITELRAQIAALLGQPGVVMAGPLPTQYRFTKDLQFGMVDPEVRLLQQFLNQQGFAVSASGPGAPGEETNLFGFNTRAALVRYQLAKGIQPAAGYFGPLTRASIDI